LVVPVVLDWLEAWSCVGPIGPLETPTPPSDANATNEAKECVQIATRRRETLDPG